MDMLLKSKGTGLRSDHFFQAGIVLGLLFIGAAFTFAYRSFSEADYLFIIHFTGGLGIDRLGSVNDVTRLLALGAIGFLINAVLAVLLYRRERLLSYLLVVWGVVMASLLFIAILAMIRVNTV